mmetsp:Transcript_12224/g.37673  ORF Transcript_12224/g.37673 Transcript_12224/m.37673 type:complete len:359 (-) Transcript_12224:14-1090(-)
MQRDSLCDLLVHVNALLPCLVVWYTLGVLRSVFAAVVLYEAVLVVGPIVTLRLRTPPAAKATRDGVVRLARALVRPSEWRRCGQTSTGVLCVCGFGCFFIYLICFQRPLEYLGIVSAIRDGTAARGLYLGSKARDAAMIFLGVWFCTANPVLEELFWRGYCYNELGRLARPEGATPLSPESATEDDDDEVDGDALPPRRKRRGLLDKRNQTTRSRWLTSFYFASFHAVVGAVFCGLAGAVVVFAALTIASRVWIWLGERPPFGFPFVVAVHAGCDVAVVLVVSACDFGWTAHHAYWIVALSCLLLATAGGALLFLAFRKEKMPTDCPRHPCARGDDSDQELPLAANDSVGDGEGASFV